MTSSGEGSDIRWDSCFRRDLRHELRENLLETQRTREVMSVPDELLKKIKEGDKLYDKVVSSREAAIDSEHFRLLSEIARHQSQSSRGELVHFDQRVYCEKLLSLMGGRLDGSPDWRLLGKAFIKSFKVAPTAQVLYGALDPVPVVQKSARQTKRTSKSVATERPKELAEFEEKEETTTKDVAILINTLKKLFEDQRINKINYFEFIIDPISFSHTIENIFHFAFLIKEGRAGLKIENGEPYIHLDVGGESTGTTNQGVISINMKMWKDLIDKYQITEAMIKRRR